MQFFIKFFNNINHKSSIKFSLNIFFLKHMLSTNIKHTLLPHFFLPYKTLKIKFIKNYKNSNLLITAAITLLLAFNLIYFMV